MAQFPVSQFYFSLEALKAMPNNLLFFGFFAAYISAEELAALRQRLGDRVCAPEAPQPFGDGPGRVMRRVQNFTEDPGLTGPQIATILRGSNNWFVFVERSLYIPSH